MIELIKEAFAWLGMEDTPIKSDIIFLFGCSSLSVPQKGLELWKQKYAETLQCNGLIGNPNEGGWTKPYAQVFATYLENNDVPHKAIFIQEKSLNTLEDVQFGINQLRDKKVKHDSLLLVSRPFHQRRAYATLRKQFPSIKITNCPSDHKPLPLMNKDELKKIGLFCISEYEKLIRYAEKGDLERQEISKHTESIFRKLKQELEKN